MFKEVRDTIAVVLIAAIVSVVAICFTLICLPTIILDCLSARKRSKSKSSVSRLS